MVQSKMLENSDNDNQEITCENCNRPFSPKNAHQISVRGPNEADYMCPWCKRNFTASPSEDINRPPKIVAKSIKTNSDGLTPAKMTFDGGAWLQYWEDEDGWVYEEMYNSENIRVESYKVEFEKENCDPVEDYLNRAINRYQKYTKTGLRLQRPHIAAVLLH